MEATVAERILEDVKTIRKGVIKIEDTDLGKHCKLFSQMKLALDRIEDELGGSKPMRYLYDLRESQVRVHELGEKEKFAIDENCSIVKFYCQVGDTLYFQREAIVPFTEDDETYFVKLEIPAKTLMKHLNQKAVVKVWVGDHSQVVWSPKW